MTPSRKAKGVLRRQDVLANRAAREQLKLLRWLRRETQAAIGEAVGYRLFHLSQVLDAIDRAISEGVGRAAGAVRSPTEDALDLGAELVDQEIGGALIEAPGSLVSFGDDLLQGVLETTTAQVHDVWMELGAKLKGAVRRASLSVDDPFAAIQQVARQIRDPKTFGTAETRAEAIIRTEVNRSFGLATHRRMLQGAEALGGRLRKGWLSTEGKRTRETHRVAGRRYRVGGNPGPIPVSEPFIVGGAKLMHPLDPAGPAKETVNCRCREFPVVMED